MAPPEVGHLKIHLDQTATELDNGQRVLYDMNLPSAKDGLVVSVENWAVTKVVAAGAVMAEEGEAASVVPGAR